MMKLLRNYVVINGDLIAAASLGGVLDVTDPYAYEVIRLIGGKPLFLQEHYTRLTHTLELMGHDVPLSLEELRDMLTRLAAACGISDDNAKLMINHWNSAPPKDSVSGTAQAVPASREACDIYLTFLDATYPTAAMYDAGVRTGCIHATRNNPRAKIGNRPLRLQTNDFIRTRHIFEALLVDPQGNVTEGSRSNVFFLRKGHLYTSPAAAVLSGVTRQAILRICSANGIPVIEQSISSYDLHTYDAAFISGTSPKVLPIRSIDNMTFDVHDPTLRRIMKYYDDAIRNDLTFS